MDRIFLAVALIVGLAMAGAPQAEAKRRPFNSESACWCSRGGGGEIPTPFGNANRTAELADGEPYTLIGLLSYESGLPYLAIDFKAHPWLASARRKLDPRYGFVGRTEALRKYEGKIVKILGTARAQVIGSQYEISIELPDGDSAIELVDHVICP